MDEHSLSVEVRKKACEILAEFAPCGTQGLAEGICKKLLGVSKEVVYEGDHEGDKITCITETSWFGQTKTYCKFNKDDDNG